MGEAAGDSGLVEGMTPAGIESLRTEGGADMGCGVIWTGEGLEVGAALNLEGSTLIFSFTLLKKKDMVTFFGRFCATITNLSWRNLEFFEKFLQFIEKFL